MLDFSQGLPEKGFIGKTHSDYLVNREIFSTEKTLDALGLIHLPPVPELSAVAVKDVGMVTGFFQYSRQGIKIIFIVIAVNDAGNHWIEGGVDGEFGIGSAPGTDLGKKVIKINAFLDQLVEVGGYFPAVDDRIQIEIFKGFQKHNDDIQTPRASEQFIPPDPVLFLFFLKDVSDQIEILAGDGLTQPALGPDVVDVIESMVGKNAIILDNLGIAALVNWQGFQMSILMNDQDTRGGPDYHHRQYLSSGNGYFPGSAAQGPVKNKKQDGEVEEIKQIEEVEQFFQASDGIEQLLNMTMRASRNEVIEIIEEFKVPEHEEGEKKV